MLILFCPLLMSMHFLLSFGSTELLYFKFCPENDNLDESPIYRSIVACKMLILFFNLNPGKSLPSGLGMVLRRGCHLVAESYYSYA